MLLSTKFKLYFLYFLYLIQSITIFAYSYDNKGNIIILLVGVFAATGLVFSKNK